MTRKKGVGTFPVRVGQTFARYTTMATIVIAYAVVIYLVATNYFSTFMLFDPICWSARLLRHRRAFQAAPRRPA